VADPLADLARLVGVSAAVVSAMDAVDAVLRDRGLRAIGAEQSAAALLAGARASAELSDHPQRWLAGSVRLSTELLSLSSLVRRSPAQVLARAHALVAAGQLPNEELGRVRLDGEVSRRLLGLSELLIERTAAPSAIVAAVAHAELATLCPFGAVDGIIARAVEHMILIAGGVDPRAVIVPEAGHLKLRRTYPSALAGYATGSTTGVHDWLLHCLRALAIGAESSPLVPLPRP
jgi:hypothetical protein